MLERINQQGNKLISEACTEMLEVIKEKKKKSSPITVAEIGVGVGATANEVIKLLDESDNYYMFSFDNDVIELEKDLKQKDYCKTNLYACGNTRKKYDSYAWSLAKLYNKQSFDIVYLDGAHTFLHDGITCCLLKKMIKKNGIIILDDIDWSFSKSRTTNPKKNPAILDWLTQEQIESCQVALVEDIFMKDDKNWKYIKDISSKHRSVYKRIH